MEQGRCAIHSPILSRSAIELLPNIMLSTLIWFWLMHCLIVFLSGFVDGISLFKKSFILTFYLIALHPYLLLPMGLPRSVRRVKPAVADIPLGMSDV